MDWNWYFAALAQSAAAIIGIFSAFIFTKIINNQTFFSQKKRELTSLLIESDRLKDLIEVIDFKWFFDETRAVQLDIMKDIYAYTDRLLTPEEGYKELKFSRYDTREDVLESIRNQIIVIEALDKLFNSSSDPPITDKGILNERFKKQEAISKALGKIDAIRIEVVAHISQINAFIDDNKDNPESSKLITGVITSMLFLFYATVIYPLSFLPITGNPTLSLIGFWYILLSLKGALLGTLGITFTVIFVAFVLINRNMKYSIDDMTRLSKYAKLGDYSEYFDNYYDHNNE